MPEAWAPPEAETEKPWQPPEASDTSSPARNWSPPEAVSATTNGYSGRGEFAREAGAESAPLISRYSPAEKAEMEKDLTFLKSPLVSPELGGAIVRGSAAGITAGVSEIAPRLADVLFPKNTVTPIVRGATEGAGDILSSLTTPTNLALAAAGGPLSKLGKLGTVLLSSAFEAQAVKQAPEQWRQFKEAYDSGDYQKATRLGIGLAAGVGLPFAAVAIHGVQPPKASLTETLFSKPEEVKPSASEITSPAGVPSEQIRSSVDETTSLRQQGQAPEARPEAEKIQTPEVAPPIIPKAEVEAVAARVTPPESEAAPAASTSAPATERASDQKFNPQTLKWEPKTERDYEIDALDHRHTVIDGLARLGVNVSKTDLPNRDQFATAKDYFYAMRDAESRMRSSGAKLAGFTLNPENSQQIANEISGRAKESAAQSQQAPKLLPGETQGDLISSTQPEDLKLVGEKGTDFAAKQTADEAAARAAEEARLKTEHEQGLLADFQQYQKASGSELLDAIESGGGLPALSSVKAGDLSGELQNIREEFATLSGKKRTGSDYNKIFKSDAPALDQLTQHLKAQGFDVETPADTLQLIKDRIRSGKPIYGNEARGAALEQASFGTVGALPHPLPSFLKSAVDYFTENTPSQIWNTIKGSLDASLGKTFAKTTIADRAAGEAGARWISAKIAAPHLADTFATNVLEGSGIDARKFGAALTEDNLRSIKAAAETPEAKSAVSTIIGAKGSPFKTEAEYKAFLADPAVQQAIERHKELWQQSVEPMYRKAQLLDPSEPLAGRGEETGARINLYNDTEGTGKDVVGGTGKGNLTGTFRRKSPFAVQAKGTGQSYNINYNDIMANTFGRQLEIAAKNDFETKLVDSGNAVIGKPGENPVLPDGEKTVSFPLKRTVIVTAEDGSKIPVNQNIYVRKSLATEYRNAANVDRYDVPGVVKAFANAANKSALAGLTDASVHGLNLMTALFTRPSIVGTTLTDSLLSTFGRADVPITIGKVLVKAFGDNKAQVAKLAEIGAMKPERATINPLAKFIQIADKSTRLVLDDTFQKMADAGLVENTETNRREFINQVGAYSIRAQGGLRRMAREVGFGPFATAGTTFNTLGLRTATLSPGVKATSPLAAASLRANVLSKWVGATVLVGTLNYLLTKDKGGGVSGRPGVPVGSVDTGLDDQNGRPLSFSVYNLLGLGRALRVTGIRGAMEASRKGLNLQTALDASARDVANSAIAPFAGPIVRFGTVALTGSQPAINVPRTGHVAAPGENQFAQNFKDALLDANPVVKSFALAREPGGNAADAIRQQIPRMSLQPTQRPEFIEKYPEIVHKAQASGFIDDVIRRARNMKPEARTKFVNESLDKLSDEDRAHAVKTLKYRKIEY